MDMPEGAPLPLSEVMVPGSEVREMLLRQRLDIYNDLRAWSKLYYFNHVQKHGLEHRGMFPELDGQLAVEWCIAMEWAKACAVRHYEDERPNND